MADTDQAMTRGLHHEMLVTVLNSAGSPQDLTSRTLRFTAKRSLADADAAAILNKTTGAGITHATPQSGATLGQATIVVDDGDTLALPNHSVALHCTLILTESSEPYPVIPNVPPNRFWLRVGPSVILTPNP